MDSLDPTFATPKNHHELFAMTRYNNDGGRIAGIRLQQAMEQAGKTAAIQLIDYREVDLYHGFDSMSLFFGRAAAQYFHDGHSSAADPPSDRDAE
ncbi:hypothetical protein J43TS9_21590 [Paenibacillus cineris]|nr:hypothetical protein J43TS9_21590 [Paenibacillus cineris]